MHCVALILCLLLTGPQLLREAGALHVYCVRLNQTFQLHQQPCHDWRHAQALFVLQLRLLTVAAAWRSSGNMLPQHSMKPITSGAVAGSAAVMTAVPPLLAWLLLGRLGRRHPRQHFATPYEAGLGHKPACHACWCCRWVGLCIGCAGPAAVGDVQACVSSKLIKQWRVASVCLCISAYAAAAVLSAQGCCLVGLLTMRCLIVLAVLRVPFAAAVLALSGVSCGWWGPVSQLQTQLTFNSLLLALLWALTAHALSGMTCD